MNDLERKIDEMHKALIGDEYREGLVKNVQKNTKFRERAGGYVGFFTALGAAIGWVFHKIID